MALLTSARIPKQINPKARARLIHMQNLKVKRLMKAHWFLFEPQSMKSVIPYNMKGQQCSIGEEFSKVLTHTELTWVITCYVLARESNGKNHLTEEVIKIKTPCKHSDISELTTDYHMQLVDEFKASRKSQDFITAAWIANTEKSPTLEEAYKLLEGVGAWDLPSDREEAKTLSDQSKG